ncbi:MAG TPA: ABC transporter permease [Vicinamibacterales bacterium]|jgi:ABC-type transport system involved in multi-copper enzyme maturation permease subunit|nr:ABC transporter permease [Vicinamibacterales bacterium]
MSTPSLWSSSARIFDLSLGQMLWSRRSVFLALLLGGPVVLAALIALLTRTSLGAFRINGAPVGGATIFGMIIWLLYIRFILPILGVFYGTSLIADEVDDKTITYLFTRPIPRSAVLLGKYLAYLACTVLLVLPSVILVFFLIVPVGGGSIAAAFPSLVADLGMLAVGLTAYGAVFSLVGARVKRPLVVGLVFAFGWEPTVLLFPGYVKRATVAYYLQALVTHEMPQDSTVSLLMQVFREVPSVAASLLCLTVIVALTLWLAGRAVEQREYVLEQ